MNEKKIKNYFSTGKNLIASFLRICGLLILLSGVLFDVVLYRRPFIGSLPVFVVIGAPLFIGGIIMGIMGHIGKVTDIEYDSYCESIIQSFFDFKEKELRAGGKAISKVYKTGGYSYENIIPFKEKTVCKDGAKRSSVCQMAISFIVESSIYYFARYVSVLTGQKYETEKIININDVLMFSVESINNVYAISFNLKNNENLFILCKNEADAREFYSDLSKIRK